MDSLLKKFSFSAKNGGRTVQFFTDLRLRVLGIKHDEEISISIKPEQTNGEDQPKIEEDLENEGERRKREGNRARLNFPHPVFETQLLPGKRDFFLSIQRSTKSLLSYPRLMRNTNTSPYRPDLTMPNSAHNRLKECLRLKLRRCREYDGAIGA